MTHSLITPLLADAIHAEHRRQAARGPRDRTRRAQTHAQPVAR
jgi:hypothetical protein